MPFSGGKLPSLIYLANRWLQTLHLEIAWQIINCYIKAGIEKRRQVKCSQPTQLNKLFLKDLWIMTGIQIVTAILDIEHK